MQEYILDLNQIYTHLDVIKKIDNNFLWEKTWEIELTVSSNFEIFIFKTTNM